MLLPTHRGAAEDDAVLLVGRSERLDPVLRANRPAPRGRPARVRRTCRAGEMQHIPAASSPAAA